jgi:hypothetical protein
MVIALLKAGKASAPSICQRLTALIRPMKRLWETRQTRRTPRPGQEVAGMIAQLRLSLSDRAIRRAKARVESYARRELPLEIQY